MSNDKINVVAIDGPVGVGKSSVARKLAQALNFQYLDTGAMYRSLIWKAKQSESDPEKWTSESLVEIASDFRIHFTDDHRTFWEDEDITQSIREEDVSREVYRAADLPELRKLLVAQQQAMGLENPSVLEGRDITTIVFPNAKWKFYLDASPLERAQRRWLQLKEKGFDIKIETLMKDLRERDLKDRNRSVGGLKVASDSLVIDTTSMTERMVIDFMSTHIKRTSNPELNYD